MVRLNPLRGRHGPNKAGIGPWEVQAFETRAEAVVVANVADGREMASGHRNQSADGGGPSGEAD